MVSEPGRAEQGPRAGVRLSAEVTLLRHPGLWLSLWASVPHLHPQGLVQVSEVGRAEGESQVWEAGGWGAGGVGGRPWSSGLGGAHPPPAPPPTFLLLVPLVSRCGGLRPHSSGLEFY